jgi:HIV Tat-specific factor 1
MFTLEDMRGDQYEAGLTQDILREVEGTIGEVERIRVFSHNPEGVVELKFTSAESAEKCIKVMQGRYYSARRLECAYWDGKTDYKRVRLRQCREEEDEERRRIEEFGQWIEDQNSSEGEEPQA